MELIKIELQGDKQVVSARELHKFLEVETDFTDWCKRMFEYGFTENQDFNLLKFEEVRFEGKREVRREITDYALTMDTAKEIAMIQRSEKGKQARQYFIGCEKQLKSKLFLPHDILARLGTQATVFYLYVKALKTDENGWHFATADSIKEATGLSVKQQARIRQYLCECGLLEEKRSIKCFADGISRNVLHYSIQDIDLNLLPAYNPYSSNTNNFIKKEVQSGK